jgi:hypothetical protein
LHFLFEFLFNLKITLFFPRKVLLISFFHFFDKQSVYFCKASSEIIKLARARLNYHTKYLILQSLTKLWPNPLGTPSHLRWKISQPTLAPKYF